MRVLGEPHPTLALGRSTEAIVHDIIELLLRTFQRHVAKWRALRGPERDVIFEQVHLPGRLAQSDFTHMDDLGVTLAGSAFPHLLFHLVLTYSNVEATICFSESFESLAEGL